MPTSALRALLLTVGTGDLNNPQATLFAPLTKSMRKDRWDEIVLLPSRLTARNAGLLGKALQDLPVKVRPLRRDGDENDADASFTHFNAVLSDLRARGFLPQNMCADFTRGTKAMSAALTMAAMRHDLPRLRYIVGTRDQRGMVLPGTETIREISLVSVTYAKALDEALMLAQRGSWQASINTFPVLSGPFADLVPEEIRKYAAGARPIAEFHLAWDRLDYALAMLLARDLPKHPPSGWGAFLPTRAVRAWVAVLAEPLSPSPIPKDQYLRVADRLRMLAVDLWANGLRRLRDGMYEDAALRAYRVLELLGQIRLFLRGYDSGCLPPDDPAVRQADEYFRKKGSGGFSGNPAGTSLFAARETAARFLKRLGDPLAGSLIKAGERAGGIPADLRNKSVLIHGFLPLGGNDRGRLEFAYSTLRKLLEEDDPVGAKRGITLLGKVVPQSVDRP